MTTVLSGAQWRVENAGTQEVVAVLCYYSN